MANNKLLVDERQRDIGNFLVGRLLPFRKKRQVGPFTFIDHMGPATIGPGNYLEVDQHPHIGLSTLTYLLEGAVSHKDSTGAEQSIGVGDVGFMTAGKAVTHTERTPIHLRDGKNHRMHGYQVWVALPKEKELIEPTFSFIPKSELPIWRDGNLTMTLVAGSGFGKSAPLKVYSPLFMLDVMAEGDGFLDIQGQLEGEIAIVVTQGEVSADGEKVGASQMLISKTQDTCCLQLKSNTRLLLFGGQPLPEERYLYWNFVSSSKERLEVAKRDWANKKFPKVPGDHTYIPLPGV